MIKKLPYQVLAPPSEELGATALKSWSPVWY